MTVINFLEGIDSLLWNGFLVFLLIGVGVFLTYKLKGMQFKYLFLSLRLAFRRHDDNAQGDISQFQSLMTALAATIGIGSIAGMATAIMAGGFGAVFWMWVMAFIGMVTKYAEAILAVKYRTIDETGNMCGGPMYYISRGLNKKWLGGAFALFGALSAFAGGNLIQSQSIADATYELFQIPNIWTGLILAFLVGIILVGGIKNLGKINAVLVPTMALLYIIGGIIILIVRYKMIPGCFGMIFQNAFSGKSIFGGAVGFGIMRAVQMGIARGISSNEAGLGSSPIAAAAAKTDVPGRQALISMSGVFLSSFIVCTITVLVIGVTGVAGQIGQNGSLLNGAPLVMRAFNSVIFGGKYIVATGLVLFGFSTILGWSYYGEKCIEFLFGQKKVVTYRIFFVIVVFLGSLLSIDVVWPLADIMNGLMALPNLVGIFFLSDVVITESAIFFNLLKREKCQIAKKK